MNPTNPAVLPTQYQQFIHLSRYARWDYDKKRRETWGETVDRYFNFFQKHLKEKCEYSLENGQRVKLEEAVRDLKVMPSMRVEYYLSLLKHSKFILGNSSSGIMEAPYYGIPTIDVGSRQNKRAKIKSVYNVGFNKQKIIKQIDKFKHGKKFKINNYFGEGKSSTKFLNVLKINSFWKISNQKQFIDIKF